MTDIKVFSKEWFKKYSKAITWVARLPILGELIFNFKKYGHYVDRKKVCEVTPNSVVEYLGMKEEKAELRQHFFVRNEYALRLQKVFYPIWITFHIWDIITRPIPQLNLGFDTLTVYPDASSGATTCDGRMRYQPAQTSFANIIAGATASSVDKTSSDTTVASLQCGDTDGTFIGLDRGGFTFDTHELTTGATISSAIFSIYGGSYKYANAGKTSLELCSFSPANNNDIVVGDFDSLGSTSFANVAYDDYSLIGYNDFTCNSSGISNISKDGISRFGLKLGWDLAGSFTGTYSKYAETKFYCIFADSATNKPKLVVTYTVPVTFIPQIIMM